MQALVSKKPKAKGGGSTFEVEEFSSCAIAVRVQGTVAFGGCTGASVKLEC